MREISVEDHLREQVQLAGGLCEKHTSPGRRGPPDDLVTWPWGEMDLVETKSPVGRLSKLQTEDHKERAKRGVPVYILNTKEKVDRYVAERRQRGAPAWLFSVPLRTPVAQPARVYVIDA